MSLVTLASDNFTRANANPLSGSWTVQSGLSALQIVSNTVEATALSTNCVEWYNGVTWPTDHWSQCTLSTIPASGSGLGPTVRNQTGSATFYLYDINTTGWILFRVASGSFVTVTSGAHTFSNGDVITMTAKGTSYGLYQNGIFVTSNSDSVNPVSGNAGMKIFVTSSLANAVISAWSGGSFTYDPLGEFDSGGQALPGQEPSSAAFETNQTSSLPAPVTGGTKGPQNSGVLYQTGGGGATTGFGQIFPTGRS